MTSALPPSRPTLILVVTAAPPAQHIGELVTELIQDGWNTQVVATPTASSWADVTRLVALTGRPVTSEPRKPHEPKSLPPADAVAVVPATFNTINQWCAGINNTVALGVLNESLGARLPIIVAPYVKPTLAAHPVFERNLAFLRDAGVEVLETDAIRPRNDGEPFRWKSVVNRLRRHKTSTQDTDGAGT